MFLESTQVKVFPSTRRGTNQVSARLITEYFLVGIVNKLIDTQGFVITPDPPSGYFPQTSTAQFEFNIHGYYFVIANISKILSEFRTSQEIYARIKLTDDSCIELKGQDETADLEVTDDSVFRYHGVEFVNYKPSDDYYYLLLFKKGESTNWYVPSESRIKFFTKSISIDIDGGEIV